MKDWRKPLLLFLVLLPLVLGLLLVFQDTVRDVVILPVRYFVWLGGLVLRSIDQSYYWIALLLVLFLLLRNNLSRERTSRTPEPEAVKRRVDGPISRNLRKVNRHTRSYRSGIPSPFEFRLLLMAVIAHRERQPVEQVEGRYKDGMLDLPPEIRSALQPVKSDSPDLYAFPLVGVFKSWMRSMKRRSVQQVELRHRELEFVVEYMETQLEAEDDHASK